MANIKEPPKSRRTWLSGEKNLQIRVDIKLYRDIEDAAKRMMRSRSAEARHRLEESFIEEKE
jgi:hypothetical protein